MFLNDSCIKPDCLDVDSKSRQHSMKEVGSSTAGLYFITIKGLGHGECHYLSTSIHVQMAPQPAGAVCVCVCIHCMGLCMHL